MKCIYCDNIVPQERVDIGKKYCTDKYCIAKASKEWAEDWRLVLMPKQGYAWVKANDVALQSGKSSGR